MARAAEPKTDHLCELAEARATLGRSVLASGASLHFDVYGGSMWPILRAGDRVQVEMAKSPPVRGGDIIVCRHGAILLAHRVVAIQRVPGLRELIYCKGDTRRRADPPVGGEQVVGRIVARERHRRVTRLDRGAYAWLGAIYARVGSPLPWLLDLYRAARRRRSAP